MNKGLATKKIRIMGKGRHGVGYNRQSIVTVKVEKIDFEKKISECKALNQKSKWAKIQALAEKKKNA